MTKEELIKRLIEMRKTGADETLDRVCESSTGCEYCPLYPTGRLCSHQTIDYLLDYIIENESWYQETNLEHYFEDSSFTDGNGYIIKVRLPWNIQTDNLTTWLLSPYEEPTYKLTQFEYDLLDTAGYGTTTIADYILIEEMHDKGYFKNIPTDVPIKDILENAEVIDNG